MVAQTHTKRAGSAEHRRSIHSTQVLFLSRNMDRAHHTMPRERKHFSYSQIKPYISMKNIEKFQILKWKSGQCRKSECSHRNKYRQTMREANTRGKKSMAPNGITKRKHTRAHTICTFWSTKRCVLKCLQSTTIICLLQITTITIILNNKTTEWMNASEEKTMKRTERTPTVPK